MQANPSSFSVVAQKPFLLPRAKQLASELQLPWSAAIHSAETTHVLVVTSDRLELRSRDGVPGPVAVDFANPTFLWRLQHGGGLRQAIARAAGLKAGRRPRIIDATAGFGEDGFVLASLGCTVHLIERSPIIAALLADGLERAMHLPRLKEAAGRLSLQAGDSIKLLNDSALPGAEVIYLDPMFPDTGRTAGARKEMFYLRQAVGDDADSTLLLGAALAKAEKRVVVKRPRLAPVIEGPRPSFTLTGKSNRFDVYLK